MRCQQVRTPKPLLNDSGESAMPIALSSTLALLSELSLSANVLALGDACPSLFANVGDISDAAVFGPGLDTNDAAPVPGYEWWLCDCDWLRECCCAGEMGVEGSG